MTRTELISKVKELNIATERPAHQMKNEVLEQLIANHGPVVIETRGRKINPESERQKRLALRAELEKQGFTIQRGRKVNENSERQKRLARFENKRAHGIEVKRGRPKKNQLI